MNILQITASYGDVGGAARICRDIDVGLRKRGHTTSVFAGTCSINEKWVRTVPKSLWHHAVSKICANDFEYYATDFILETEEYRNADVVQFHNVHGWYFNLSTMRKMSMEKPVVWTLHDMWSITPYCAHSPELAPDADGFFACTGQNPYPSLLWDNSRHLENKKKRLYEMMNVRLVSPSRWLMEKVKVSVLKNKPIHHIPNGIDTEIFSPFSKKSARGKFNLPQDKFIVLFIAAGGITNAYKGGAHVQKLISLFEKDTDILFLLVGAGNETYEKQHNNVRVFNVMRDKEMLAHIYSSADIFLLASEAENFPLVVLEAMACGLPVVSFDVGGVREVVSHEKNGYIVASQTTQDLEQGIKYIKNLSEDTYNELSRAAMLKIQNKFSLKQMVNEYEKLYKQLV